MPKQKYRLHRAKLYKKSRLRVGLSQRQLADLLDYTSVQTVSNFERGKCDAPYRLLNQLADILKIPPQIIIDAYLGELKEELEKTWLKSPRKKSNRFGHHFRKTSK